MNLKRAPSRILTDFKRSFESRSKNGFGAVSKNLSGGCYLAVNINREGADWYECRHESEAREYCV